MESRSQSKSIREPVNAASTVSHESAYLIPKPYSYYCKIIQEDHFHFLGLGISG